ncbi:MAG TPA: hypothetical protein VFG10_08255 [Saprospiraceae bacterium]|nr:hypothetical protein [Saprospiraceae bacterium]
MKHLIILSVCLCIHHALFAQGISFSETGAAPHASAMLDVQSNTKGVLIPRMSVVQRVGIVTPAIGLLVYETDSQSFWYYDSIGWVNLISGKSGWSLSGNNSGIQAFLGTTNNQSLLFKANNQQAGKIDLSFLNTSWGANAGSSITIGTNNTALGRNALFSNTTGIANTAGGEGALFSNTTGYYNTAFGMESLYTNSTGSLNTSTGSLSLKFNTTGSENTASGYAALYLNTTGYSNVGIGTRALFFNQTSHNLVAVPTEL